MGDVHAVQQGEGGEQGDPLMSMLFYLGQHAALASVRKELFEGEQLFAFLDDLHVVCKPERVVEVHGILSQKLWEHARISLHAGKTKVWLMCVDALETVGFEVPSWEDLAEGRRPEGTSEDDPCQPRIGWQKQGGLDCSKTNEPCFCRSKDQWEAFHLSRSLQTEFPGSTRNPFSFFPASSCLSPCLSAVAGVAVLLTPLATTVQFARQQGCWGVGGWALESVAARVCREAGARTNFENLDGRRLEVVVDGLPFYGGAQVGHRHNDGLHSNGCRQERSIQQERARS